VYGGSPETGREVWLGIVIWFRLKAGGYLYEYPPALSLTVEQLGNTLPENKALFLIFICLTSVLLLEQRMRSYAIICKEGKMKAPGSVVPAEKNSG
jgi:hypothetical protein